MKTKRRKKNVKTIDSKSTTKQAFLLCFFQVSKEYDYKKAAF
jgi:hypothetical protein